MNKPARHEMQLAQTLPTGEEEWFCPTCNRRFLMRWFPKYSKLVLESGDEYALHSGNKGEMLHMGELDDSVPDSLFQSTASAPLRPAFEANQRDDSLNASMLKPWRDWMDSVDL